MRFERALAQGIIVHMPCAKEHKVLFSEGIDFNLARIAMNDWVFHHLAKCETCSASSMETKFA